VWLISVYNGTGLRSATASRTPCADRRPAERRYDLIPNLVETAKGYIKHERGTLEAVITARNTATPPTGPPRPTRRIPSDEAMDSCGKAGLSGALGRLFAVSESYPDLKANQTMMQLSEELTGTRTRFLFRAGHKDAVMSYNTAIESFPDNFVAGFGGFQGGDDAGVIESAGGANRSRFLSVSFSFPLP